MQNLLDGLTEDIVHRAQQLVEPPRTVTWQDVLLEDGQERSWQVATAEFGERAVQWAAILRAVESRELRPPLIRSPMNVFVSYRHGTEEGEKWVKSLARNIEGRGHQVSWDQGSEEMGFDAIADLVATIATCHLFIMVIDGGYVERLGEYEGGPMERGWAYVEHRTAQIFADAFGIRIVGFLREGTTVPKGSTLSDGVNPGTAFAVETPDKLDTVLKALAPYVSRTIPTSKLATVKTLLVQSYDAGISGEHVRAFDLVVEASTVDPEIIGVQYRLCLAAMAVWRLDVAHRASELAAELDHTSTFARYARILSLLLRNDIDAAAPLIGQIQELFATSWRLKLLQLGMEVSIGEAWPIESCAKAAARMFPGDLQRWTQSWRWAALGLSDKNRSVASYSEGKPLPISANDLPTSSNKGSKTMTSVRQVDVAKEIDGSGFYLVPTVYFESKVFDSPSYLWNLDIAILASAAGLWLPRAVEHRGWDLIALSSRPRERVIDTCADEPAGLFLTRDRRNMFYLERK